MRRPWLFAGVVLAIAALLQPVLAFFVEPAWAGGLGAAMAAELVTGREAAIPLAVAAGVPAAWIALTSILQNLAMAGLVVPAASSAAHAFESRPGYWSRLLHKLHADAASGIDRGSSAWALFGFMLLPFVANGAVIAGIIGILAGIGPRRVVIVLVAAVTITAIAWSFGYAWMADALAKVHPALRLVPAFLALGLIAFWVVRAAMRARSGSA